MILKRRRKNKIRKSLRCPVMIVKVQHGKAFVSKASIEENDIFEGAALYESSFEENYCELDLYEFFSLAIIHAFPFLIEAHEKTCHNPEDLFIVLNISDLREKTLFLLHLDLKRKGWRIRRGLNYGADFLLYDLDPNLVHSKYAVYLFSDAHSSEWNSISAMNRVCSTARKTMLTAVPTLNGTFQYLQLKRWVPESNRE